MRTRFLKARLCENSHAETGEIHRLSDPRHQAGSANAFSWAQCSTSVCAASPGTCMHLRQPV